MVKKLNRRKQQFRWRIRAMNKRFIFLVGVILIVGCTVGPDYKRPTIDNPAAWRVDEKAAQDTANTAWWQQFDDPVLNQLIADALKQSYDIRIAGARVDEYMGRYWVGRSGLFPQIGADGSAGRSPCH